MRRRVVVDGTGRRCKLDGYELVIGTDGNGRSTASCPACDRRRRHQCQDCGRPVQGRSWRCEAHKLEAQRRATRLSEERWREERNAASRARYRALPASKRREKLDRKVRWRQANVARVKLHKRRGRLNGTWGYSSREKYLEAQAAQNAKRVEKKREHARRRYYELNPVRPEPKCLTCGTPIAWTPGHGRPALRCPAHNPWAKTAA